MVGLLGFAALLLAPVLRAEFRAGAAVIDITPVELPVLVNGGMTSREISTINTRLNARAIVLAEGETRLALVIVDSCMMSRKLLDEAKALAAGKTGIPADRMLISATHTHTAPASMGCLGTSADPRYSPFLIKKLAEAIFAANANLEPAKMGWGVINAADFTALRQWIRRPDRLKEDPFGNLTVRANMHPGFLSEDATGEAGPEDPDLSLLSIQAKDGRPIAVMGNFSMHYFGDKDLSADYFGLFSEGLKTRIAPQAVEGKPGFVGIMSHAPSGDIWRRDYSKPAPPKEAEPTIQSYADGLLALAMEAYGKITYKEDITLAMAEAKLPLKYRVPDKQRLEWAQRVVAEMGDRLPKTQPEVYAREAIFLHEAQQTELILQAVRIGELGLTAIPNETYALTGLKLKAFSPLAFTINIELANGAEGYIPPAEQMPLGGYNTWEARTAGLEVQAEPKIAETCLTLLEKVAGKPRKDVIPTRGPAANALAAAKPAAWWRLDEFAGPRAVDATGNERDAFYEPGVVFHLEGARSDAFAEKGQVNRAAHFAGGRMQVRLPELKDKYTVSLWFWNGMPKDARDVLGWMLSRGHNFSLAPEGEHLGVSKSGNLIYLAGTDEAKAVAGKTEIPRWTWCHAVLVRAGQTVRVYLNGNPAPEIEATAPSPGAALPEFYLGGRSDASNTWEGKLDEIAVFDRALTPEEVASLAVK